MRYDGAPQRRSHIMAALRRAGFLSVVQISEQLGVSQMTVRRDLRRLAEGGEVVLVHGGVSLPPGGTTGPGYASRQRAACLCLSRRAAFPIAALSQAEHHLPPPTNSNARPPTNQPERNGTTQRAAR